MCAKSASPVMKARTEQTGNQHDNSDNNYMGSIGDQAVSNYMDNIGDQTVNNYMGGTGDQADQTKLVQDQADQVIDYKGSIGSQADNW